MLGSHTTGLLTYILLQINNTPKPKAMFKWLIMVLFFRSVFMVENGTNYHVCMYVCDVIHIQL